MIIQMHHPQVCDSEMKNCTWELVGIAIHHSVLTRRWSSLMMNWRTRWKWSCPCPWQQGGAGYGMWYNSFARSSRRQAFHVTQGVAPRRRHAPLLAGGDEGQLLSWNKCMERSCHSCLDAPGSDVALDAVQTCGLAVAFATPKARGRWVWNLGMQQEPCLSIDWFDPFIDL